MKLPLCTIVLTLVSSLVFAAGIETQGGCRACDNEPLHGPLENVFGSVMEEYHFVPPLTFEHEIGDVFWRPAFYRNEGGFDDPLNIFPVRSVITDITVEYDTNGIFPYVVKYHYDEYHYKMPGESAYLTEDQRWGRWWDESFYQCSGYWTDWDDLMLNRGFKTNRQPPRKIGATQVQEPRLSNAGATATAAGPGSGGCASCPQSGQTPGQFRFSINLGNNGGGNVNWGYAGNLAQEDLFSTLLESSFGELANYPGVAITGTLAAGTVVVKDRATLNLPVAEQTVVATTTFASTHSQSGQLETLVISVTPTDLTQQQATVHAFTRVQQAAAAGGSLLEGIRYTRTVQGGSSESVEFYNAGVPGAVAGSSFIHGVFRTVNTAGDKETLTAAPLTSGTFTWVADAEHPNGGHYTGTMTEMLELESAGASQPMLTMLRTYRQIGTPAKHQMVLTSEQVQQGSGAGAVTTTTRHGYYETCNKTANVPDARFGMERWQASTTGEWTLTVREYVPDSATPELIETLEVTPWLDGPAADFGTQASTEAFFTALASQITGGNPLIAGCRITRMHNRPENSLYPMSPWLQREISLVNGVVLGTAYDLDASLAANAIVLSEDEEDYMLVTSRTERWNGAGTQSSWSTTFDWGGSTGLFATVDQSGTAAMTYKWPVSDGMQATDNWRVKITELPPYPGNILPDYQVGDMHPLWTTTTVDENGRVSSEVSRFGNDGTPIQTMITTYTGETGVTRSTGGITLSSQEEDVIANGQRTSTRTDIDGVTTTTVTDEATGEMISETRLGVTTNYATDTDANGNTTRTVTQTAGGTTRTVSITITDGQGRTVSSTDANGGETTYLYENQGRKVTESLPGGGTRITENYLDGQLKSLTGTAVTAEYHDYTVNDGSDADYEAGSITETVYFGTNNGAHWRKTTTNFLGQVLREEEPSPVGANEVLATTHTYNAKGQRVKTSRTRMADMLFEYDEWGRAYRQGYDMDGDGELTVASTDILSESNTDYVQEDGQVLERTVRKQYTKDGEDGEDGDDDTLETMTKRRLLEGSSWQQVTQADGSVLTQTSEISEDATTHEITRTVTAQQVSGAGALPITQTQTYEDGRLTEETQPGMSQAISYRYNDFGELWKVIHPLSGTTTRTYDEAGRLYTVSRNDALAETYAYDEDSRGLVATITHTDSVTSATTTTTYKYDLQGRMKEQGGTAEYPLRYEYDTLGRLWKLHTYRAANPDLTQDGDVTTWDYIAGTNALWKKTDAANRSVTYSYNEAGLLETRTRPRTSTTSIVTTYDYQQAAGGGYIPGRLTRVDYSDSTPDVTHEYDRAGRRKTTTDAAGTHTFTYDAASGQPDTWTVAGTGVWSGLSVDNDYTHGQRSSRATSLGGIALPTAGYTYQPGTGRMETVTSGGVTATYRYNTTTGWNEGVTYSGSGGLSSTRTPDALGRLDTISWSAGGNVVSGHDYTLNGMNRRTAAQREDGSQWSYGYNDRGEVTSAAKEDAASIPEPGKQFGFSFDGLGNRTSSSVSSLVDDEVTRSTGYTANALNQYEAITHPQPGWLVLRGSVNAEASVSIDGEPPTVRAGPLWHYETEVDNSSGARRRIAEITATRPTGGINNGPVSTSRKGAVFIPPPSETPTYDWDGNLTSDARWDYTWDGENRLIAAEEKNIASSVAPGATPPTVTTRQRIENAYDSMNRRLTKKVYEQRIENGQPGTFELKQSLVFLYDQWNMIAELSSVNQSGASVPLALLRSFEWGLDVSGTMTGAGGVGGLLVLRFHPSSLIPQPSSGAYAPTYDGNGNITELVNLASNTLSARYEYGPFGETISVDGGAVAAANPFRFSTKYLDVETGMVDYGLRIYIPPLGRWLSQDPIEEQGGINFYAFVENNPVSLLDLYGLKSWKDKDPLNISMRGAQIFGLGFDGSGIIDAGADESFRSRGKSQAMRYIEKYFDINGDGKLDKKDCPPFKLNMTGYSWGAWSALEIAHEYHRNHKGVFNIRMGLVDPVSTLRSKKTCLKWRRTGGPGNNMQRQCVEWSAPVASKPGNVVFGINYYQTMGGAGTLLDDLFVGSSVPDMNVNTKLSKDDGLLEGYGHVYIMLTPQARGVPRQIFK